MRQRLHVFRPPSSAPSASRTRITTAARSRSEPTATSTSRWAMAAPAAIRRTRRRMPRTLLGKILRVDVDVARQRPARLQIPPDNPFVGTDALGALDEIWAFGVRNPWRLTFERPMHGGTGALTMGDVGQGAWEEFDYEPSRRGGRNYGWRLPEGPPRFRHCNRRSRFCRSRARLATTAMRRHAAAPRSPAATSTAAPELGALLSGPLLLCRLRLRPHVLDRARRRSDHARGVGVRRASSTRAKSPHPATSARSTSTSSARSTSSSIASGRRRDPAPAADQWRRRQRRSPRCVGSDATG